MNFNFRSLQFVKIAESATGLNTRTGPLYTGLNTRTGPLYNSRFIFDLKYFLKYGTVSIPKRRSFILSSHNLLHNNL